MTQPNYRQKKPATRSGFKSISKEETWRRQLQCMRYRVAFPILVSNMCYLFCEYLDRQFFICIALRGCFSTLQHVPPASVIHFSFRVRHLAAPPAFMNSVNSVCLTINPRASNSFLREFDALFK